MTNDNDIFKKSPKTNTRIRRIVICLVIALIIISVLAAYFINLHNKSVSYENGIRFRELQQWDDSVQAFEACGNYQDAVIQIQETRYLEGQTKLANRDWDGAVEAFSAVRFYRDADEQIMNVYYEEGVYKRDLADWEGAVSAFTLAASYSDSPTQILITRYQEGTNHLNDGDYDRAIAAFSLAIGYSDSEVQVCEAKYQKALHLMSEGDCNSAFDIFMEIRDYRDSNHILFTDLHQIMLQHLSTVGTTVRLGTYNDTAVEWVVVGVNGNSIELLAKRVIYYTSYDSLNLSSLYGQLFNEEERAIITHGLYLLSFSQASSLPLDIRKCGSVYWLSTSAEGYNCQGIVRADGGLYMRLANGQASSLRAGYYRDGVEGVRPAMHVSLQRLFDLLSAD